MRLRRWEPRPLRARMRGRHGARVACGGRRGPTAASCRPLRSPVAPSPPRALPRCPDRNLSILPLRSLYFLLLSADAPRAVDTRAAFSPARQQAHGCHSPDAFLRIRHHPPAAALAFAVSHLPCLALPCLALPCHTLPYSASSSSLYHGFLRA